MNREEFIDLLDRLDEDGLEILSLLMRIAKEPTDDEVQRPTLNQTP